MTEISDYIMTIPEKWQEDYIKLAKVIDEAIPEGFELVMQYGMPGYVVPLAKYPAGYLNRKEEPLPFLSLAAQKNYIALYHMGIYADKELLTWFEKSYAKEVPTKLNRGKSCIRLSNGKHIPFELIAELVSKISLDRWIELYEEGRLLKKT